MTKRKAETLLEATFDPRLKTYTHISVIAVMALTIVGILLIPFWLIFGRMYVNKYYDNYFCDLTTRALRFKKGVWYQTERTVPLDKIQDLTFREGPVLRYFGLSTLKVETAGQSVQGMADLSLTGIVDAKSFRESVLDQRDHITDTSGFFNTTTGSSPPDNSELVVLLQEINSTLKNIEKKLDQ